mmetsp:Transcript_82618/g.164812  ORF Transcript_82618/g.164812 Transcript_82618/m.164812 type:complete len:578 (-) Transcript_82618:1179-2912(-)
MVPASRSRAAHHALARCALDVAADGRVRLEPAADVLGARGVEHERRAQALVVRRHVRALESLVHTGSDRRRAHPVLEREGRRPAARDLKGKRALRERAACAARHHPIAAEQLRDRHLAAGELQVRDHALAHLRRDGALPAALLLRVGLGGRVHHARRAPRREARAALADVHVHQAARHVGPQRATQRLARLGRADQLVLLARLVARAAERPHFGRAVERRDATERQRVLGAAAAVDQLEHARARGAQIDAGLVGDRGRVGCRDVELARVELELLESQPLEHLQIGALVLVGHVAQQMVEDRVVLELVDKVAAEEQRRMGGAARDADAVLDAPVDGHEALAGPQLVLERVGEDECASLAVRLTQHRQLESKSPMLKDHHDVEPDLVGDVSPRRACEVPDISVKVERDARSSTSAKVDQLAVKLSLQVTTAHVELCPPLGAGEVCRPLDRPERNLGTIQRLEGGVGSVPHSPGIGRNGAVRRHLVDGDARRVDKCADRLRGVLWKDGAEDHRRQQRLDALHERPPRAEEHNAPLLALLLIAQARLLAQKGMQILAALVEGVHVCHQLVDALLTRLHHRA